MSQRNGHGPGGSDKRHRFHKEYHLINMQGRDDSTRSNGFPLSQANAIHDPKKKLDRLDSIVTTYRRIAARHVVFGDDLLNAVMERNLKDCEQLIADGADVNKMDDKMGVSALHIAAKIDWVEVLDLLLSNGADVNIRSKDGPGPLHYALKEKSDNVSLMLLSNSRLNTKIPDNNSNKNLPMHLASYSGNFEACWKLLQLDPTLETVNKKNSKNRTPLHQASAKGHADIVSLLMDHKADWNVTDRKSFLPLHLAAQHGHSQCCEILLEKSGEEKILHSNLAIKDGSTALILAAKNGHYKCCDKLKDSEINAKDKSLSTAVHYAAQKGFYSTVEKLINSGADIMCPDKNGNTPIHKTASQKNIQCLQILTEKVNYRTPGPNVLKQNVLHIAAQKEAFEPLNFLLKKEEYRNEINEIDDKQRTPLYIAVKKGDSECSKLLLENGANPLLKDLDGNLPLHIAAAWNLRHICQLLTRELYRTSVSDTNKEGATPLHLAAFKNAKDCCSLLLDKGAFRDARDKFGNAPIHIAALSGNVDTVAFFIRKGVVLTSTVDSTGDSPLHLASSQGHFECCKLLLKSSRKSMEIVNKMGKTPLDIAFEKKHDKVFEILILNLFELKVSENMESKFTRIMQKSMHQYTHEGLKFDRYDPLKSVIQSSWWTSCFNSDLCEEIVCPNFQSLVEGYPDLAEIIFDKCITTKNNETNYCFEYFENPFFYLSGGEKKNPFCKDTGELMENAQINENSHWVNDHPLRKAIECEHLNLLLHPLTNEYLRFKWVSYTRNIFFILLMFEIISVVVLSFNLGLSWNLKQLQLTDYYSLENTCVNLTLIAAVTKSSHLRNVVSILQFIVLFIHICMEAKFIKEMKKSYMSESIGIPISRILRCFGMLLFCIPLYFCEFDLGIKMSWQWQIGIGTLLLSWLLFIHTLNKLPILSVFMPITRKFATSFAKVFLYICLILFLFSFIFYLLLNNTPAFATVPGSFIKSVVWMLGDLGYDDAFVENYALLHYPALTNMIFLFFVTSISFFIINMVITNPSDQLNIFRDRATIHKASSRITLFLKLDMVFVQIRKKYTKCFWKVGNHRSKITTSQVFLNFFDHIDKKSIENERDRMNKQIQSLDVKMELFTNKFDEYMKKNEYEPEKLKKDIQNISEKLDIIWKKINSNVESA